MNGSKYRKDGSKVRGVNDDAHKDVHNDIHCDICNTTKTCKRCQECTMVLCKYCCDFHQVNFFPVSHNDNCKYSETFICSECMEVRGHTPYFELCRDCNYLIAKCKNDLCNLAAMFRFKKHNCPGI